MNILFANTQEFNPQIGGVERVTDILTRYFINNFDVKVYFLAAFQSDYSKSYTPSAEQFILPNQKEILDKVNIDFFAEVIQENSIDVVVNQAGNIERFCELCFKVKQIHAFKLISELHIDPAFRLKEMSLIKPSYFAKRRYYLVLKNTIYYSLNYSKKKKEVTRFYTELYNNSDRIILLSDQFIPAFKSLCNSKDYNKLITIPNPFISDGGVSLDKKEKILLYVGRLDQEHKGVDRLIKIWKSVSPKFPDWQLLFVGDGPSRNDLEAYVHQHNIQRVILKGFTDPTDYYKSAAILCMTSNYEGLPMVLLEAIQYKCIPIAYRSFESLDDIIKNAENGYSIKPFSVKDYKFRLTTLMKDEQLQQKLRETEYNSNMFSLKSITKKWMSTFTELLNS